eukprot:SAG31_NODE_2351_length_5889_cov_1.999482_5_plen_486_part_00
MVLAALFAIASFHTSTQLPPSPLVLQTRLNLAISQGVAAFTIPAGVYNFSTTNLDIAGAVNLRITATGAALWFAGNSKSLQPGVNISNCDSLHLSGLSINYYSLSASRSGHPGITYNILNSSAVTSEDITIHKAPFFSVTAFNGDGGHVFRRFHMPNDPNIDPTDRWPHQRDAFHFTDLRRGVLVEDSNVSGFGDDFLNSHNTIMLVLKRESPTSLLLVNPHLQNVKKAKGQAIIQNKNTVYGTNCVLENLRSGDSMRFFSWPKAGCLSQNAGPGKKSFECSEEDFTTEPLSPACIVMDGPSMITDEDTLADSAAMALDIATNYSTTKFDASDVWRVRFSSTLPTAVARGALVNIDSFSTPGTIIRNNTFSNTKYNLGRFKSDGGVIADNTFYHAGVPNLEISPLLTFFEGGLPFVRDVLVTGNKIVGEGTAPIHCSTMCGRALPAKNSTMCPLCSNSAFAKNISVENNLVVPKYLERSGDVQFY